MNTNQRLSRVDYPLLVGVIILIIYGSLTLYSIAGFLFPQYFVFIAIALIVLFVFMQIDFDVISLFSKHLYIFSIIFLILPLFLGQVSRGAIRWIPIGALTIQPAEIVRPFILVFFANYFVSNKSNVKGAIKALILLAFPLFLILIQPSLGVATLTFIGFVGVFLASGFDKKHIIASITVIAISIPLLFSVLAPYQRDRVTSFLNPQSDPLGSGYNSIQSMISVGSGKFFGSGLGKGTQTQLEFLPERHTDFIFASVAEELGFVGAMFMIVGSFFVLSRLINFMENAISPAARAFIAGLFLTLFAQTIVNIGMNLGILPITGLPLPLVSAGGSSLIATMIGLGLAMGARKVTRQNL